MKYLQSFVYLVLFQLALVFGRSNRRLTLTYNSNAACIAINQTLPITKITLDFHDVNNEQIPLLISEYIDTFKFRNVPNFDDFANYTYLENKPFIKANGETKNVEFDLQLRKSFTFPETVYNKTITNDGLVEYNVTKPGVYCIYLPLYSYDDVKTHPLRYYTHVTVENEALSPNVLNEISTQVNLVLMFGSFVVVVAYFYPMIRTSGGAAKLPPVLNQIFPFLVTNLVYRLVFLILWAFYFFYPSDTIYDFALNYYNHVELVLLDKWFRYIVASVYLGSGIVNLPVKPSSILLKFIFASTVLISLVQTHSLSDIMNIGDILINQVPYEIVDKSMLVTRAYKFILTDFYSDNSKHAVLMAKKAQAFFEITTQVLTFAYGIRIAWYLKGKNARILKVFLQSLLVHLIAWSYFGKFTIASLYVHMKFTGVFDVSELLSVVGNVIEMFDLKVRALQVVDMVLLWIIWSTKKPYNVDEVEHRDDKKKRR